MYKNDNIGNKNAKINEPTISSSLKKLAIR